MHKKVKRRFIHLCIYPTAIALKSTDYSTNRAESIDNAARLLVSNSELESFFFSLFVYLLKFLFCELRIVGIVITEGRLYFNFYYIYMLQSEYTHYFCYYYYYFFV